MHRIGHISQIGATRRQIEKKQQATAEEVREVFARYNEQVALRQQAIAQSAVQPTATWTKILAAGAVGSGALACMSRKGSGTRKVTTVAAGLMGLGALGMFLLHGQAVKQAAGG